MVSLAISPETLICDLDNALRDAGQPVTMRRLTLGPTGLQVHFDVEMRANVRPVKPEQLIAGIDQAQRRVILSPTGLAGFPAPIRKNDKCVIDGVVTNVEFVKPIRVDDVLVRVELTVTG